MRAYANTDASGRVTTLVGVHTDITARKKAEEDREKLQSKLNQSQKMESIGRLAGGVAHDFNNMLGVIIGHTEMAMNRLSPADPVYAHLQEIERAAGRSADLTRQLLAFARRQTISPKVLDLNEAIDSSLRMLRRLIGENLRLAWLPGDKLAAVKVDPSQLDQILTNLVLNARDAIGEKGTISVRTANAQPGDASNPGFPEFCPEEFIMLTVADDGCGMDYETVSHLFEPFFTTKELGKGTGLGLAIVYGIVRQNNGYITVASRPDEGTAFSVFLPKHRAAPEPVAEARPEALSSRGHETIMIVEDEAMILELSASMLKQQGYKVIPINSPHEALRICENERPHLDLLLTDVIMPGMNGRELSLELGKLYPGLKIIFISGYTAETISRHGVLDANVNFIQKPFSLKALTGKIRTLLDS